MKKLFLTSGLILCVACPAFADPEPHYNIGTDGKLVGTGQQTAPNATCQYPTLGTYTEDTDFYAQWNKSWYEITLNKNTADNGANSDPEDLFAPTPIYSVVNGTVVYVDQDLDGNFAQADARAADTALLTAKPNGKQVTYTLDYNLSGLNGNHSTPTTSTTVTPATRLFAGFNTAADGTGTPVIDADGKILTAGISTAAGYSSNQVWYAQYAAATPTVGANPTLTGYTFGGWYTDPTTQNSTTAFDAEATITETQTLYAKWTANTYKLIYDCGGYDNTSLNIHKTASGSQTLEDLVFDAPATGTGGNGLSAVLTSSCTLPGYTQSAQWTCTYTDANNQSQTVAYATLISGSWTYPADVTCTVDWTANKIGLTWKVGVNATAGAAGDSECTYDEGLTVPGNPTRPGYVFTGWSTTAQEGVAYEQ